MGKMMMSGLGAALLMMISTIPATAMSAGNPVEDPTEAPWVATLAHRGPRPLKYRAQCGGVLIEPDRVLTAAHCVVGADPRKLDIHLNARVLSADPGVVRGVRGISALPGYKPFPAPHDPTDSNDASARDDLAIIVLDRPVHGIRPLPLAAKRPRPGTPLAFYSHGHTGVPGNDTFVNDVLHRGDLIADSAFTCRNATPAVVDRPSVGCASDPERLVTGCNRDSGSPLVIGTGENRRVAGVFSFGGETAGRECGEPSPAYYADAAAFRRWILRRDPETQPFPMAEPTTSGNGIGQVVTCSPPKWDLERGGAPTSIEYQWHTVTTVGAAVFPTPIPGADSPAFTITPELRGESIQCQVKARNAFGITGALSAPIMVTD